MLSGPSWLVGLSPDDLSDKMLSYVAKEPKQAKDFFQINLLILKLDLVKLQERTELKRHLMLQ